MTGVQTCALPIFATVQHLHHHVRLTAGELPDVDHARDVLATQPPRRARLAQEALRKLGVETQPMTTTEMDAFLARETADFHAVVKAAGIQP